jgi:hypothetical protein
VVCRQDTQQQRMKPANRHQIHGEAHEQPAASEQVVSDGLQGPSGAAKRHANTRRAVSKRVKAPGRPSKTAKAAPPQKKAGRPTKMLCILLLYDAKARKVKRKQVLTPNRFKARLRLMMTNPTTTPMIPSTASTSTTTPMTPWMRGVMRTPRHRLRLAPIRLPPCGGLSRRRTP